MWNVQEKSEELKRPLDRGSKTNPGHPANPRLGYQEPEPGAPSALCWIVTEESWLVRTAGVIEKKSIITRATRLAAGLVVWRGMASGPVNSAVPTIGATIVNLIVRAAVIELAIHRTIALFNGWTPPVSKVSRMRIETEVCLWRVRSRRWIESGGSIRGLGQHLSKELRQQCAGRIQQRRTGLFEIRGRLQVNIMFVVVGIPEPLRVICAFLPANDE